MIYSHQFILGNFKVNYICDMEGINRVPPGHSDVRQSSGDEAKDVAGRIVADENGGGI